MEDGHYSFYHEDQHWVDSDMKSIVYPKFVDYLSETARPCLAYTIGKSLETVSSSVVSHRRLLASDILPSALVEVAGKFIDRTVLLLVGQRFGHNFHILKATGLEFSKGLEDLDHLLHCDL